MTRVHDFFGQFGFLGEHERAAEHVAVATEIFGRRVHHDRRAVVGGLKFIRRLFAAPALAKYVVAETVPGSQLASDAELLDYARQTGGTVFHCVGTCRMGSDDQAVLDPQLRVRGVEKLRVIDASVMPRITSANTNASSLIAKIASERQQKDQAKKLDDAFKSLQDSQNMVSRKNVLDPFIYMPDGSFIDTTSNLMTMANGDQFDIATGAKYVDPTMIIQMANGSYLDTKNNILTMADGTRIDSVTGIKLSVTA